MCDPVTGGAAASAAAGSACGAGAAAGAADLGTGLTLGSSGLGLSAGATGLGLTAASAGADAIGAGLGSSLGALGTGSLAAAAGGSDAAGSAGLGAADYGLGSAVSSGGAGSDFASGLSGLTNASAAPVADSTYGLGTTNYGLGGTGNSGLGLSTDNSGLGLASNGATTAQPAQSGLSSFFQPVKDVYGAVNSALSPIGGVPGIKTAASLYDAYGKYESAQATKSAMANYQNQINNSYAPGSAEYNAMAQTLARKDAAAGRNSQYGTRSVDLAARIAQLKDNALTQTYASTLKGTQDASSALYSGLGSAFYNWAKADGSK